MFGWFKKKQLSSKQNYTVQQDPNMTRWENHHCNGCKSFTRHKVMRWGKKDKKADYQCLTCYHSEVLSW